MGSFKVCARRVAATQGSRPSHAFIAFHWCLESLSRLTGEPFGELFARVGGRHGFAREPERWPTASQLRAAILDLISERQAYLLLYRDLVAQRKAQKAQGRRIGPAGPLDELEHRRRRHNQSAPRVGCWGWKCRRCAIP